MTRHEELDEILAALPTYISQRQDDLNDQLSDLWSIARKLKMYDAADYIRAQIHREG